MWFYIWWVVIPGDPFELTDHIHANFLLAHTYILYTESYVHYCSALPKIYHMPLTVCSLSLCGESYPLATFYVSDGTNFVSTTSCNQNNSKQLITATAKLPIEITAFPSRTSGCSSPNLYHLTITLSFSWCCHCHCHRCSWAGDRISICYLSLPTTLN